MRCRRKFLRFFPGGFRDETYVDWEQLQVGDARALGGGARQGRVPAAAARARQFSEIAARAVRVEQRSRHSMIFSFEKMALRDAIEPVATVRHDVRELKPRDMIDLQSFIWVQGSDEYEE